MQMQSVPNTMRLSKLTQLPMQKKLKERADNSKKQYKARQEADAAAHAQLLKQQSDKRKAEGDADPESHSQMLKQLSDKAKPERRVAYQR